MNLLLYFKQEARALCADSAALLTVFGGVLLYSFLYPLPYLHQTPRDLPLIVVNLDNSQASRRLEHLVDSSPNVRLARRAASTAEAEQLLVAEKMAGILVIPENFYGDLLRNRRPTLTLCGDAGFFLVYGKVVEGMNGAAGALSGELALHKHALLNNSPAFSGTAGQQPIDLELVALFNSGMGYLTYVIPAVYMLILHQTLIIGIGLVSATRRTQHRIREDSAAARYASNTLFARTSLFILIYWLLAMYYFGGSFDFYHIPRLAGPAELHLLLAPFFLSAAFLGICLGVLLPRRELVTLVVLVSSMPLIFLSGFIWPTAAIPPLLTALSKAVPVIPAISAYLALNHLGADFHDILEPWAILWLQTLLYGALAWYLLHRNLQTQKPPQSR